MSSGSRMAKTRWIAISREPAHAGEELMLDMALAIKAMMSGNGSRYG